VPGVPDLFVQALRLENAGKPDEALTQYRLLLRQEPGHVDAWHNHGLLLARLGRLVESEQSHREYVRLHAQDARALADLADVLLALERYDEALAIAERAVAVNAGAFLPALTAGLACSLLRRFAEAQAWFARSQSADPAAFARFVGARLGTGLDRDLEPRAIYLLREYDRLQICDWRRRDEYVREFGDLVNEGVASPPLVFRSLALPVSLATRRKLADGAAALLARDVVPVSGHAAAPSLGGRIRLGYVSPDFRTHPTGMLSAPLFRLHDRTRFEVHAFSLNHGDDSRWRREVERDADGFHSISGMPYAMAASVIRGVGIDVLIDLAGTTTGAQPEIFAARPAPVQVSYLGFPGGSGAGLVDYLVSDPVCVPEGEVAGYSEAIARLPSTFWICELAAPPPAQAVRTAYGLPEGALVLYAHHPGQKIYPEVFAAWMEILRHSPRCVLWLLEDAAGMRDNLLREARARGIAERRLVFAPRVPYAEYRARIALADLALDTPVYNGGATTLDALMAGVPVLTCPSHGFAGRMAASALHAARLAELVVSDIGAYVSFAVQFAKEEPLRKHLAAQVRAAVDSPLFDASLRTREIEAAFVHMLDAAFRRESPASFRVPPI
jgi:protein O-GlcNAc transferase